MNWKPIESAPRDMQDVLVYDGHTCHIAHQNKFGLWTEELAHATEREGFYLASAKEAKLSHWMPLPSPPVSAAKPPEAP